CPEGCCWSELNSQRATDPGRERRLALVLCIGNRKNRVVYGEITDIQRLRAAVPYCDRTAGRCIYQRIETHCRVLGIVNTKCRRIDVRVYFGCERPRRTVIGWRWGD